MNMCTGVDEDFEATSSFLGQLEMRQLEMSMQPLAPQKRQQSVQIEIQLGGLLMTPRFHVDLN